MSTSFLARRIKTRRGVVREVENPSHNCVVRGRGEAANIFKIGEELHKSQQVSPGGRRTEKADKFRKDFWMLKMGYQKCRRCEEMNKIIEEMRSRGRMGRRGRNGGGWWRRNRPRTLKVGNRASGLLRRRRICKKFGDVSRSGSSKGNFY